MNQYYQPLLNAFGSWEEVWRAARRPLQAEIPANIWDKLQHRKKTLEPERIEYGILQKQIKVITREDPAFPGLLLQIDNVPCMLYYCGSQFLLNRDIIAVVGSRKATTYGLKQARSISRELAKRKLIIASGLARGIDASAHEGALEADEGTIAILGCGLDTVYPRENAKLFQRIKEKGLLISEFPCDTAPLHYNFPIRNRLISGISKAVFIVEAEAKSGTLITCDYALEQGKEIFALPGPVTSPNSIGTLRLIQNGAKLVIYPQDILEEMGYAFQDSLAVEKADITNTITKNEKKLLGLISWEPVHIDELLAAAGPAAQIYQELLLLEIKGLIKQLPGRYYIRI